MSLGRSEGCAVTVNSKTPSCKPPEKGLGKEQNHSSTRRAEGAQPALPCRACFPKNSSQKRLGGKNGLHYSYDGDYGSPASQSHSSNRKRELLGRKNFSANLSSMMGVKHSLQEQFCCYKTCFQLILHQSVRICTKPTFSLLRILFSSCFLLHLRL